MKTNESKSGFFFNHRFAIGAFIYLALYNFLVVTRLRIWKVTDGTYLHHIVDYKTFGFRSGLLPGSIFYGLFGSHASETTATVFETVLLLLFFLGLAIILEKFIKAIEQPNKKAALFLIFLFLSGPFTFAIFSDTLGMLDVYWVFLALIFFFVIDNRYLRFTVPVLFALSLMVHMSALLCYVVLFGIILLYRISVEQDVKKKKSYIAVFCISIGFSVAIGLYFLVFKKEMPMSVDEFNSLLEGRGGKYFVYYDYTFYDHNYYEHTLLYPAELYDIENPVVRAIRLAFARLYFLHTEYKRVYMPNYFDRILRIAASLILLAPPMAFFYRTMVKFFKSVGKNKLKKFCVFLMMVQFPFTVVLGCLFSLDIIRWFAHAFIIAFAILLYVIRTEDDVRNDVLSSVDVIRQMPATWIYSLAYFFVTFSAYT